MDVDDDDAARNHFVHELGLAVSVVGEELHGRATVVPELLVPGSECLRISVLAAWTDLLCGLLALQAITPRVPVTLDLDVHLYQRPRRLGQVHAVARNLKVGRAVTVATVDFTAEDGEPVAVGTGSFMAAPDVTLTVRPIDENVAVNHGGGRLAVPFAERVRCERIAPGVASVPRADDGINSSNTVNGGLIALTVEEAALSAMPGTTLSSLAMRYLRPARIGPVVATATPRGGMAMVEVRDAGSDDRVAVIATTRAFT